LNFGKKINLPQTAIVALRAPFPIPYFDEGTAWYPSFDNYGECKIHNIFFNHN